MKYVTSPLVYFIQNKENKGNLIIVVKFLLLLVAMIATYSLLFHVIMLSENREYSWITGFYWTLTVMSTLGFGDITFSSDLGMIFTIVVLMSGVIFLLIMLPFTFIEYFYAPWLHAMSKFRTPHSVPDNFKNHVILVNINPITRSLAKKLKQHNQDYVLLSDNKEQAKEYFEQGFFVIYGDIGNVETYENLRVKDAAMVVATESDEMNTKVAFTVKDMSNAPIVTNATRKQSIDVLKLSGSTHTLQLIKMFGEALARKTLGISLGTNVIWKLDQLLIVEANAMHTPLENKTLGEIKLRETIGVTIIGIWEKGEFKSPHTDYRINPTSVLMLAGTEDTLKRYEADYSIPEESHVSDGLVLVLGGGKVGRAAAEELAIHNIPYKIVDKDEELTRNDDRFIHGDAADKATLIKAGIDKAKSIIITSHDDSLNLYLILYCRKFKPELQIISRSIHPRNVTKLHKAGADIVMSFASMGSNTILNYLNPDEELMAVEGLSAFCVSVPTPLIGVSLAKSKIREENKCSVVALIQNGKQNLNPDPFEPLKEQDEILMIGTIEAEANFRNYYSLQQDTLEIEE